MKRKILLIAGFLILILGGFGLWKINKDYYVIWDNNIVNVKADDPMTADKVKIEFGISVNTINRPTDEDLFNTREKHTVLRQI